MTLILTVSMKMNGNHGRRSNRRKGQTKLKCRVFGCPSVYERDLHLTFHTFPKPKQSYVSVVNAFGVSEKIDRLKAWSIALRMNMEFMKTGRICSLHFTEKDYVPDYASLSGLSTSARQRLLKIAVPSCNLPQSSIQPKTVNQESKKKRNGRYADRMSVHRRVEMRRRKQEFNKTNEDVNESDSDTSSPPKRAKLNNNASQINSHEVISISDKYNVPFEIKEEPVDILEDEVQFSNLESVQDMRDPLACTPAELTSIPQQNYLPPKKIQVKNLIPKYITKKVIGQIPTTQVKGLAKVVPQNPETKIFKTVKLLQKHPSVIKKDSPIILNDTSTSTLPGNIIFAKMGDNPPQAFVIQSNRSPVITNVTSPVITNVTSLAKSNLKVVQTTAGTTDTATSKLQKIVIQPKFASGLMQQLKTIPTIIKNSNKPVEKPKPAPQTPEKLVQKIIIHPSKPPQNLPALQAKPVLTAPRETVDLTTIELDLDAENPVVNVPILTPNPIVKNLAPNPTDNVIKFVTIQPKKNETIVPVIANTSKIDVQPQNNVQPTDQQKIIVAKQTGPEKVSFNTGVKSILVEALTLSAQKINSQISSQQKSVLNINKPVDSVPQRILPQIIQQAVVENDDVIVEPYNFEALKFDLSMVKGAGLPAFWCYLKASEGLLFMYLGDTQKHVSKSILIDPNMGIEVRAEGQIVKTNASKKIGSIKDLYQIMEYISKACVCKGPTENFCKIGLFEAKIVTQVNRCLECRSTRAKNLTEEQTQAEKLKEIQNEIKKLRALNYGLRIRLNRNSKKKQEKSENT